MKFGKKAWNIKKIERPEIKKKNEDFINLSNNEAALGKYREYPYTYPLYQSLASYLKTKVENVLPVRGAEEGIKIVFDAFVEEGMQVVRPNPTFGMLEVYEKLNKAKVEEIDYDESRQLDLERFIKKINKNSFVYIANPDNPTGTSLSQEKLQYIVNAAKKQDSFVLLDETYKEFNNRKINFKDYPNVIIVGSFSKSHGLAGIRLGYIKADKKIINVLKKLRPMEEVNSIAAKEGINISKNKDVDRNINIVERWKKIFKNKFPQNYLETHTNFILLKFKGNKNISLYEKLYAKKILTRANFKHSSMNGVLRITIGTNKEMRKVLKVLKRNN